MKEKKEVMIKVWYENNKNMNVRENQWKRNAALKIKEKIVREHEHKKIWS